MNVLLIYIVYPGPVGKHKDYLVTTADAVYKNQRRRTILSRELIHLPWPGWEMVREIGSGTFGTVYEIKHDLINQEERAALKVLSVPQKRSEIKSMRSEGMTADEITQTVKEQADRILQEYMTLKDLQDAPNIVRCNAVHHGMHKDGMGVDVYILMELLIPLLDKVDELLQTEAQIIGFAIDLCHALIACEDKKILHRDIKPENIFVTNQGVYKLGDFGIARSHDHTTYGTQGMGTPSYMAPEVANGEAYNNQADIYSLGIVLYWLLNKRRTPFMPLPPMRIRESDREKAKERRCSGESIPAPVNGSNELKRIVLKACAFDLSERYKSARAMKDDLVQLYSTITTTHSQTVQVTEVTNTSEASNEATVGLFNKRKGKPDEDSEATIINSHINKNDDSDLDHTVCIDSSVNENAKKKSAKRKGTIAFPIAVVCIVATLCIFLFSGKTKNTISPQHSDWSDWSVSLPADVSIGKYDIEEQVMYRSRQIETTTSTVQSSMDGWELYDTSASVDYGNWSEWSADMISPTDTRMVESKTEYSYRDKSVKEENGWGNWTEWSTKRLKTDSTKTEEARTVWAYYYHQCPNCGLRIHGWGIKCPTWAGGCGSTIIPKNPWYEVWSPISWEEADLEPFYDTGVYYTYVDGNMVFKWDAGGTKTQYRYGTKVDTTSIEYSDWSEYSDMVYTESETREVKTRTLYRYCDQQKIAVYHFRRYGKWSEYSFSQVIPTDSLQVETMTLYRYRKK